MFYHKDGNGEKMKNAKKIGGFFITLLLILGTLSFSITIVPQTSGEGGNTLYVDDDGTADYTNIQDAIDDASNGDTVFVYNGTYYENVVVNKSVNLIGEDRNNTIIDGGGSGDVVYVSADYVNISGLTIRNCSGSTYYSGGVVISSSYNKIGNCNISDNNQHGIVLLNNTKNNTIVNTKSTNNWYGIFLNGSHNNTIYNCDLSHNFNGTLIDQFSNNNTFHYCNIYSNIMDGIALLSSDNKIHHCNIYSNNDDGIESYYSSNNTISHCNISNNFYGIRWQFYLSSNNNTLYHNNFINNTYQAYDAGLNTWDNGYPSGGNYWSDFDEPTEGAYDNNSDGIVDSPYNIPGDGNQDRYPFIDSTDITSPFTTCNVIATVGDNGWYVSNVSIELIAVDNDSGINYTKYRIDGGNWQNYTETFTISQEGVYIIEYYSVDNASNQELMKYVTIKIDKTPPTLSYYLQPNTPDGKDGWYLGNVEVTISANDETSNVSSIQYQIDNDGWIAYTGYFLITTEGPHIFSIFATDIAGNIAYKNTTIKIDKTPPVISIPSLGEYVKGKTQIQWNASDSVDDNLDGNISLYLLQGNQSIEIAIGINNTGIYEWNTALFPDFSPCNIKVVAEDDAGSTGFNTSHSFVLDNTPPSVEIVQPKKGDVLGGNMLSIFWNASDNIDTNLNTIWIEYSNNSGKTWNTIASNRPNTATGYDHGIGNWEDGNYMIKVNATDDAGNEGVNISGNFTIDRVGPTVKINNPESGYLYINVLEREILPPIPIQFILAFTEPLTNISTIIVGKITVEVSVTDEFSDINNVTIFAGEEEIEFFESPYEYEWNCPLGKYDLRVVAYDRAGNKNKDPAEIKNILCINW